MAYRYFTVSEDGFAGYMVLPSQRAQLAVVMMLSPDSSQIGEEVADEIAQAGYIGMQLPLYGQKGQPKTANCLPLEPLELAVKYLRERLNVEYIVLYGYDMGSVFATLGAYYIDGIDGVILVSPTHVNYAGVGSRKRLTGHSLVTYNDEEVPFLTVDFQRHRSFEAFRLAYDNYQEADMAMLPVDKLKTRLLILASDSDEVWPAAYSLKKMEYSLRDALYPYPYLTHIFHNASHYIGIFPEYYNQNRLMRLFQVNSNTERRYRGACEQARHESKQMIFEFLSAILQKGSNE